MVAHYSMAVLLTCVCVWEEGGRGMNKVHVHHVACHQAILDVQTFGLNDSLVILP